MSEEKREKEKMRKKEREKKNLKVISGNCRFLSPNDLFFWIRILHSFA